MWDLCQKIDTCQNKNDAALEEKLRVAKITLTEAIVDMLAMKVENKKDGHLQFGELTSFHPSIFLAVVFKLTFPHYDENDFLSIFII